MTLHHLVFKVGRSYIIVNVNGGVSAAKREHYGEKMLPLTTQERILKKLKLKPLFEFNAMGGVYRMEGIINARKYFADNKFAKLHRVADGVELKVQKAKKEIRKEKRWRDGGYGDGVRNKKQKN